MRRAWLALLLAGLGVAGFAPAAAPEVARTLEQANAATLEAFSAGDVAAALARAEAALALAEKTDAPAPVPMLHALNNLGYLLGPTDPARAATLLDRAIETARHHDLTGSEPWFLAIRNRAALAASQTGPPETARLLDQMMQGARGTQFHALAAGAAATLAFGTQAYPRMTRHLREMIEAGGAIHAAMTLDDLYAAQNRAEAEADIAAVSALIDARILYVSVLAPDQAQDFAHAALWTRFFLNYKAGQHGAAADALRDWAGTGRLSPEETAFIDSQAGAFLTLTQLSAFSLSQEVQLGQAELAVAFAEALDDPTDPRLGLALRERAAAETGLGLHDAAETSLYAALATLEATPEGRRDVHLVLADLAENAANRGKPGLAQELYARSDRAQEAALAAGAAPLAAIDRSIGAANRARLALDGDDRQTARLWLDRAWAAFDEDRATTDRKTSQKAHAITLHDLTALWLIQSGDRGGGAAQTRAAIGLARDLLPPDHPTRALALSNGADLLFVLDHRDEALALLDEAVAVYAQILPPDAPFAVQTRLKKVIAALTAGDRSGAIAHLRAVTEARQSPTYRSALPEAAADFEMLAWALLDLPGPADPARTDEALAALQWTQVSRSAEALAMMADRLAAADAGHAALLRHRQDLDEEERRLRSALLSAYAEGAPDTARRALHARHDARTAERADLDRQIAQAGLETAGLGPVRPLGVAEIQALLRPNEALVTFLLPGLRPEAVPGLGQTSNRALAITRDGVHVAAIPETSRGALNDRITRFRCAVAISDPGCGPGRAVALRGAMLDTEDRATEDATGFDTKPGRALHRDLFGGLAPVLAGLDHLLIVPPPDLLRLPFAALVTDETGRFMIEDHALSVLPSIPSLRTLRRGAAPAGGGPQRMLGVGDPSIGSAPGLDCASLGVAALRAAPPDAGPVTVARADGLVLADPARLAALPRLPDASCELQAIARGFGTGRADILLQDAATETAVKSLDRAGTLAEYDVLVFATHGLVAGEAGAAAPGLVLTPPARAEAADDGLLTAAEIATLRLDARLVVLSACNTAAGEDAQTEGLSGLARGFLHAGARGLLVTHWSVYSEAAVEISTGLFAELRADPAAPPAVALQRATRRLLERNASDPFRRHPAYWAAFAIVGGG